MSTDTLTDGSELDLDHEHEETDAQPRPLSVEEMLIVDDGQE